MAVLNGIPLSKKLPAVIAALCLTASLSIAVVGYLDFQRNIVVQAKQNFNVITKNRGDAVSRWMALLHKSLDGIHVVNPAC